MSSSTPGIEEPAWQHRQNTDWLLPSQGTSCTGTSSWRVAALLSLVCGEFAAAACRLALALGAHGV